MSCIRPLCRWRNSNCVSARNYNLPISILKSRGENVMTYCGTILFSLSSRSHLYIVLGIFGRLLGFSFPTIECYAHYYILKSEFYSQPSSQFQIGVNCQIKLKFQIGVPNLPNWIEFEFVLYETIVIQKRSKFCEIVFSPFIWTIVFRYMFPSYGILHKCWTIVYLVQTFANSRPKF